VKRIRIAFVASTFGVGGAERVTCALASRLPRERFDLGWFFLREAGELGRELLEAGGYGVERVERHRFDPTTAVRLHRHLRRFRPDIVFCMDHHNAMLWGRLTALTAGIPARVAASHSTGLFGRRGSLRPSDRWLMEFTDRVVALSRTHAAYLRDWEGIDPGRIRVIENGIDVASFAAGGVGGDALRVELNIGAGERVVTMVAALRPEKAHDALLEAASRLVAEGRSLKFLVVGDGERRQELERRVRRDGLDSAVRFLGIRRDVARLLHVSDVLVLPSHDVVETLPLAVLEAMAAGVPVVASRVGSLGEVIEDGRSGRLIRPADSMELAEAIAYILDNPPVAEEWVRTARQRVEDGYSLERMTREYQQMFEELAG
jgi:glycosyltransferase involved in cell wall biosynthesis